MVTFLHTELILLNMVIESEGCTVISFLKRIGVEIKQSYIKGDLGVYEGRINYKGQGFYVKVKSFGREITEFIIGQGV